MKLAIIMLKNTPLEDQAKYLQILESECQREIQLVNKLLQLQRVNTTPQVWEQILLTPWLLTLLQPLQAKAIKQQQSLWWQLPNPDITIISEPTSVEQILVELVNNALKFTPFGGEIHVTIQLTDLSWRIQVTNTEVEVPQVEVERIFDRFYRIPNNDPWKTSGTGLGLTLVQKLVERLGGTVTAQSHLKSFTVVVTLPNNTCTPLAQGTDKYSLE
jgi:signal transduction histidine kinase